MLELVAWRRHAPGNVARSADFSLISRKLRLTDGHDDLAPRADM